LLRASEKRRRVDVVNGSVVKVRGCTLARDAIALNVAQVCACSIEVACKKTGVACLDHDSPASWSDQASGGTHAGGHAQARRIWRDVAPAPAAAQPCLARVCDHAVNVAQPARAGGPGPETELENLVAGHGICLACSQNESKEAIAWLRHID